MLKRFILRPGINSQLTQTAGDGGWWNCNLIRFRDGLLEKLAGWKRLFSSACSGIVRALHAYEDLSNNVDLLIGGDGGLEVYVNGTLSTVYMVAATASNLNASAMVPTSATSTVTVTDASYSPASGSTIYVPFKIGLGDKFLPVGFYTATNTGATTYTFQAPVTFTSATAGLPASFTVTAGEVGTSTVSVFFAGYNPSVGDTFNVEISTPLNGTGVTLAGDYIVNGIVIAPNSFTIDSRQISTGTSTYAGGNYPGVNNQFGTVPIVYLATQPTQPPNWFIDNLGNNSIINWTGSPLYVWTPPIVSPGLNTATIIATGPQINTGSLVASPQAQVIAYGSEAVIGGGTQDPLLVRFSDVGGYTVWTASATNQAGSYRLGGSGTRIVGAIQAPQTTLLFTDNDFWSAQYTGPPFVYSFVSLGSGCGLVASKAVAMIGRTVMWMSPRAFFQFTDGGFRQVECDVWDYIFNDLDTDNQSKCVAGASISTHEFWFFFPSKTDATEECSRYVKYNTDGIWDFGQLKRSAWLPENAFGTPLGADETFHVQQHEQGYDADGVAMDNVFVESGYSQISDGTDILLFSQFRPDFKWFGNDGYVSTTLTTAKYPQGQQKTVGPINVTRENLFVRMNARGTLVAVRYEWGPFLGFSARIGTPEFRVSPHGRRP